MNLAKVNFFNLLNNNEIKSEAEKCIRSNGVGSCGPRGFYGTIGIYKYILRTKFFVLFKRFF